MSKHDHTHDHHHSKPKSQFHKDWKTWVVVGLMLAAMAMYVLSDDESIQLSSDTLGPAVPAAE
ncbi:hypothetical protein [Aeoliella sp. SH292]|uniref:hypothetical protein n=1 Tax=Aeoliella sp. SH292 TaxID=3454464 RepID=UPI003F98FC83